MRAVIFLTALLAATTALGAPSSSVDSAGAVNIPEQPALKEQDDMNSGLGGGLFGGGGGSLECHSCDAGNCEVEEDAVLHGEVDVLPKYCQNAIRCYTAHVRDADGVEHKSKGEDLYILALLLHHSQSCKSDLTYSS